MTVDTPGKSSIVPLIITVVWVMFMFWLADSIDTAPRPVEEPQEYYMGNR